MTNENRSAVSAVSDFEETGTNRSQLSSQNRRSPRGTKAFLLLGCAAIVCVGGYMSYKLFLRLGADKTVATEANATIKKAIPDYNAQPVTKTKAETPATAASVAQAETATAETADPEISMEAMIRARMLNSGLTASSGDSGSSQPASEDQTERSAATGGKALTDQLKPVELSGSSARVLPNRDMMITQGTMIDCTLETKIVSTQAGMTSCYVTRDIYSASGRVIMLDKGSKVTGMYENNLRQGQDRLFVQWMRVETPSGVVINLASPATGALGEAGVGGSVNNHYGQRFGGAILVSLFGDVGNYVSQLGQRNSNSPTFNFDTTAKGTESMATEIIKNTINIPPTLTKNQGERVSIFVARDLDFSKVYKLKAR